MKFQPQFQNTITEMFAKMNFLLEIATIT